MKTNLKSESGFTLVELMVVVAIIGILSAVAIPNFKKYQAKSKTSEAKVQLSAAFTALQAFYADYGIFSTCLDYMGYNPDDEAAQRYFAVGINVTAAINAAAQASAVSSGMNGTTCPANNAVALGDGVFAAGKAIGSAMLDTLAEVNTAMGTGITTCTTANIDTTTVSCIGTQTDDTTQVFNVLAAGTISADFDAANESSVWGMNSNKRLSNVRTGY